MKRILALLLVSILLLSLSACGTVSGEPGVVKNPNSDNANQYPGGVIKIDMMSVGLPDSTWSGDDQGLFGWYLYKEGCHYGQDPTISFFYEEKGIEESISGAKSLFSPEVNSDFEMTVGDYLLKGDRAKIYDATVERLFYAVNSSLTLRFQLYVEDHGVAGIDHTDPDVSLIIESIIELNDLAPENFGNVDDNGNIAQGKDSGADWTLSSDGTLSVVIQNNEYYGYGNSDEYGWYLYKDQIEKVVLPDGMKYIPSLMFADCTNLKTVNIPDSVTKLGISCFRGCKSLEAITLPEKLSEIDYFIFSGCESLTEVTVPGSLKTIENYAFSSCTSLKTVRISSGVQSMGYDVFDGCTGPTTLYLPKSVNLIDLYSFRETALTDIYYEGSESDFSIIRIEDGNEPFLSAAVHYQSY